MASKTCKTSEYLQKMMLKRMSGGFYCRQETDLGYISFIKFRNSHQVHEAKLWSRNAYIYHFYFDAKE